MAQEPDARVRPSVGPVAAQGGARAHHERYPAPERRGAVLARDAKAEARLAEAEAQRVAVVAEPLDAEAWAMRKVSAALQQA